MAKRGAWEGKVVVRCDVDGGIKMRLMEGERVLAGIPLHFVKEEGKGEEEEIENGLGEEVVFLGKEGEEEREAFGSSSSFLVDSLTLTPPNVAFSCFDGVVGEKCSLFFLLTPSSNPSKKVPCPTSFITVLSPSKTPLSLTSDAIPSSSSLPPPLPGAPIPLPSAEMRSKKNILFDFFSFVPEEEGNHRVIFSVDKGSTPLMQTICNIKKQKGKEEKEGGEEGEVVVRTGNTELGRELVVCVEKTTPNVPGEVKVSLGRKIGGGEEKEEEEEFDWGGLQVGILSESELVLMDRRFISIFNLLSFISFLFDSHHFPSCLQQQ